MSSPSIPSKRLVGIIFTGLVLFYLYGLGKIPLVGPDEPRYAQVAREMLVRHDFVTPILGGHTWFEKPALLYWMMIGSFQLLGINEYAARLGPAVCGILTLAAIYLTSRQIESRGGVDGFGFFSTFVAGSTLGLIAFSRAASFDIVITMTATFSLCFFLIWEIANRTDNYRLLVGFYSFIGVSLLAKGLIGIVIPFGVVGAYYALRRTWPHRSLLISLLWGIPLVVVVSLVWYGPVTARHGWTFIDQFFIQHHFARYLSNKYHHPQPVYFYLAIVCLLVLPWLLFLFKDVVDARGWAWRDDHPLAKTRAFAMAWLVMPVLFFSFSGSKLPGYILPVLPATSFLVAGQLANGASRWTIRGSGVILLMIAVACVVLALNAHNVPSACGVIVAVPLIIGALWTLVGDERKWSTTCAIGVSPILSLVLALNCGAAQLAQKESVRDLLRMADERGYSDAPVFAREGSERTAEFYAAGRVVYDPTGEIVSIEDSHDMMIEVNRHGGKVLIFFPLDQVDALTRYPGVETIGQNGNMALIGVKSSANPSPIK